MIAQKGKVSYNDSHSYEKDKCVSQKDKMQRWKGEPELCIQWKISRR